MIQLQPAPPASAINYRLLRIAGEQFGCSPSELNQQQRQQVEKIAANEMQLEALILGSEEAQKVVIPQEALQASIKQIRQRYDSEADFYQALDDSGIDETSLSQSLCRSLKVDAVMEKVASSAASVDDTEATLFYYLHPEKFTQPETRVARHILITVNPDFAENSQDAAYQRILAIARRLQKAPKRFAEQALKHSECPTGMQGGLLGQVHRGVLYQELEDVLFALKPGQVSDPVASELGWHLLYCEKVIPEHVMALDAVLLQIREQLQLRQKKLTQRTWLKQQALAAEK